MAVQSAIKSEINLIASHRGLYLAGAVSILIIVIVFLSETVAVLAKGFPPITAEQWFSVFQENRAVGLLRTFALDIVAVSLHIPLYIALFYLLSRKLERHGLLLIAIIFAVVGVAVYLSTNTTFSFLWLSDKYAAAATEAERAKLLAAGESVLSLHDGTGPFAAFALYSIAGIMVSVVMLKVPTFNKVVGIAGIVGNALELGLPPSIDPPFFIKIDPFLIGIGGVVIIVWYILVAQRLIAAWKENVDSTKPQS